MKAKIAFLHKPHDLRIEKVELSELKSNQILIKIKACGICGFDVECFIGKSAEGRYDIAPYTPGHEWAGQDVAGHGARVRLIGHSVGRKVPVEIGLTIWKTLAIIGSGGIKNFMPRTIRFMERIRNEFDFKSLISHRYSFKEIDKAFDKAVNDKKNAFKVMLKF
ncbi:MAG: alcohol dehydrogenase catalytic domain-containing protein [Bacteroidetes bacterium]|nr:alcohol dehydrogenase catalytic domain-containing protein [Bacteroidota bacterium]